MRAVALTDRDRVVLETVRAQRACESAAVSGLFPTRRAMEQRLWRLSRFGYLTVVRDGRSRVYLLGPAGARVLGVAPPRLLLAAMRTNLLYGRVRRLLAGEGYALDGSRYLGRVEVLAARRGDQRVAAVALGRVAKAEFHAFVNRLRSLITPFNADVDEVQIFVPVPRQQLLERLPRGYQGRIRLRSIR